MTRRQKLKEIFSLCRRVLRDVLFPLAIFLLIVFLVVYIVKHVPSAYQVVNQYEVLRDLLMILLAGLAVAVRALYYFLLRRIKESVERDMRRTFSKIRGQLYISTGLVYYYQKSYDLALEDTYRALSEEGLKDEIDIIWAKNNLAYYYGEKHERKPLPEPQREEMRKLAEYVHRKYNPLRKGFNEPEWVETWAFFTARLAQTKDERYEVEKLIKEDLLLMEDLAPVRHKLRKSLDYLDKLDMENVLKDYFGPSFLPAHKPSQTKHGE